MSQSKDHKYEVWWWQIRIRNRTLRRTVSNLSEPICSNSEKQMLRKLEKRKEKPDQTERIQPKQLQPCLQVHIGNDLVN